MYKHAATPPQPATAPELETKKVSGDEIQKIEKKEAASDNSPETLRALLEKNLKWSQIIYEQNRKVNRKMLWTLIIGWIELFVLLVPLALLALAAPTIWRTFSQTYSELLNSSPTSATSSASLLESLPISASQRSQLKTLLK